MVKCSLQVVMEGMNDQVKMCFFSADIGDVSASNTVESNSLIA